MRVLFLDVDGVLNSARYFRKQERREALPETDEWWTVMLDRVAVLRLNTILQRSGAVVVVSSSWRYHLTTDDMQRVLSRKGFLGAVVGRTPRADEVPESLKAQRCRGLEIECWLAKNRDRVTSFAILDDLGPGSFGALTPYLVRTSWGSGLLDHHVQEVVALLK